MAPEESLEGVGKTIDWPIAKLRVRTREKANLAPNGLGDRIGAPKPAEASNQLCACDRY